MTAACDIAVRPATPHDFAAITIIYDEAVRHGTSTYELEPPSREDMDSRLSALLDAGYPVLVAGAGDRVLGYAYAGPFRARPAYRFMVEDSIYVAPDARGRGVGALLLGHLLGTCTRLGFRQMEMNGGNRLPPDPHSFPEIRLKG